MKKIAFKNFRRFQDFPTLELGNISIMVGRNNSGKSTMVKAILLVLDYLQNQQYNEFSFTNKSLEDANIVTFGRAKNNFMEKDEISFQFTIEDHFFSIEISGSPDDTSAQVDRFSIVDTVNNIELLINYLAKEITISKRKFIDNEKTLTDNALHLLFLRDERDELEKAISNPDFKKASSKGLKQIDNLNKVKQQIENLEKEINSKNENIKYFNELFKKSYELKDDVYINMTEETVIQELVSDFFYQNNIAHKKAIDTRDNNTDELIEFNADYSENLEEIIENHRAEILKSIDTAIKSIKDTQIYYLGANPSKQSALFSIRDKHNNLAQAIHNFKQAKIESHHQEYIFVKKWMKEFEIGDKFAILLQAGEAYEFYVIDTDKDGMVNKSEHLSDKGMGSLQAMMFILQLATIIRKHKDTLKNVTVIVEEPELNLHPEFQGKLADFFHDVNKEYHINFIIETHSEYLIRKSQNILVKEDYTNDEGLNPNPFKLHYFDIVNGPYEMKYMDNGKFDRKFGKGFFDYADDLEVETYKLNLNKNK
jgi:predicted ATPase